MIKTLRLVLALLLTLPCLLASGPLPLAEDGQPRAAIWVADQEPQAQEAAQALAAYLQRITGAAIPVQTEPQGEPPADGPAVILVGHTRQAQRLGVKIPSGFDTTVRENFGTEEGYVLQTRGRFLVVAGNSDGPYRGNLYAAFALLEKLGCRFYFPEAWGEVVPQLPTITLPELAIESRPTFAMRSIWLSGWSPVSPEERASFSQWCTRVGLGGEDLYPVAGDGYLGMLLPPSEYAKDHPEYYAMRRDGSRRLPTQAKTGAFQVRNTMLCLSNPEVLAQSVKNIGEALEGKRKLGNVSALGVGVSPPDGAPFCFCPECIKANQNFNYPTYVQEPMTSEEYFGFSAALARAFPSKFVSTMAYSNREVPPQGIANFPQNITVKYVNISCDVLHPATSPLWRRRESAAMLRQWRALTPHVMVRDYNPGLLVGLYVPECDMANLAINVPFYQQVGVKGVIREGRKVFMQTWLSYYLTAKLLWNAQADVALLKKDFYENFFGVAAAPHVQAWWDDYEAALGRATVQVHEDWLLSHVITPQLISQLDPHVEKALAAQATPSQREHLQAFALIADHLAAAARMFEAERQMDYRAAADAAGRMLQDKRKLEGIYRFFYGYTELREKHEAFTLGRQRKYEQLLALTDGSQGKLLMALPRQSRFARDRFNEGVPAQWYLPAVDERRWEERDTSILWEQQEPAEDAAGHDYDGYGWYRMRLTIPAQAQGQPVRLWLGGLINEGWVWVNGRYAGHKPFKLWWGRGQDIDFDVTSLVEPGKENVLAIRVWNNADVGGMHRRGFFYIPTAPAAAPAAPAAP